MTSIHRAGFDEALARVRQLVDPAIVARANAPTGRFRQLGGELAGMAPTWIAAAAGEHRHARARTASALMLEAANLGLSFDVRLESCLEWLNAAIQIRKAYPAAEFDRRWNLAALAVIEGTAESRLIEQFIESTTHELDVV